MGHDILVTRSSMPDYEEYIEAIMLLWDTNWIANMGEYHRELEGKLRDFLQVLFVVDGKWAYVPGTCSAIP